MPLSLRYTSVVSLFGLLFVLNSCRHYLTQEQLAEKVGISRQHMGSIEAPNIDRGLSLALLFDLANELEVEPYQLLKFGLEDGN